MTINNFFEVLETQSSVINYIPCQRYIRFVPGFFLVLLLVSIFFLSALLDIIFIILTFLIDKKYVVGGVFSATALGPLIFAIIFKVSHTHNFNQANLPPAKWYHYVCVPFTLYFGIFSLNKNGISTKSIFEERLERCMNLFPLFHFPNEVVATFKIYCFFFTISKSIPQMLSIPAYFITFKVNMWTALVGRTIILHNMVLFSLTLAILFPIRKKPIYFPTLWIAFINILSKFFGALCACGLRIIVFTEIYKTIGFYAVLIQLFRFGFLLWPCLEALHEVCPNHSYFCITIYAPFIGTVLSFLYIHPFSLKGKLYYYIIYLLNFLIDLFSLYVLTKANDECILTTTCLTIVSVACISSFGLINFFNKNLCSMVCLPERLISAESEKETRNSSFYESKTLNT